jgi:hypothetical protein
MIRLTLALLALMSSVAMADGLPPSSLLASPFRPASVGASESSVAGLMAIAGCEFTEITGGVVSINATTSSLGVVNGDQLIAGLCVDEPSVTAAVPTGGGGGTWFALVSWSGSGFPLFFNWSKTASAWDDTAVAMSWQNVGNGWAYVCRIRNIGTLLSPTVTSGTSDTPTPPAISANAADLVIGSVCYDAGVNDVLTCPAGRTEGVDCFIRSPAVVATGDTILGIVHDIGMVTPEAFSATTSDEWYGTSIRFLP